MSKILTVSVLIFISFLTLGNSTELVTLNETVYEKNLNTVSEFYLEEKEIPKSFLIRLVPGNYAEFGIYYATTGPNHKLGKTNFFYDTTRLIFVEVTSEKNNEFYLPSLKLISFADGEYAEDFIEYLEIIIKMDKDKFCKSIIGKEYANRNPIKYHSESNKCE
ncbi:hypothetical protein ABXT64_00690 [Candidatus Marifrigoribacter sp. Uisw_064]|jgi:hypothetical protein|uniref:hypothetical protein n=1 Tax=Candidatus Marifrigoribacter sp. Uisw_064 TaxID=3230970 RepID=UPI003D49BF55